MIYIPVDNQVGIFENIPRECRVVEVDIPRVWKPSDDQLATDSHGGVCDIAQSQPSVVDHNIGVGCKELSQLLASDPMLEAIQSGKEDGRSQPLGKRVENNPERGLG